MRDKHSEKYEKIIIMYKNDLFNLKKRQILAFYFRR